MLTNPHRTTECRMIGCTISGEHWLPRVPRKCDQKTEINQGDGYISLIEGKMLCKTLNLVRYKAKKFPSK